MKTQQQISDYLIKLRAEEKDLNERLKRTDDFAEYMDIYEDLYEVKAKIEVLIWVMQ